jgi:hypothetical protein
MVGLMTAACDEDALAFSVTRDHPGPAHRHHPLTEREAKPKIPLRHEKNSLMGSPESLPPAIVVVLRAFSKR